MAPHTPQRSEPSRETRDGPRRRGSTSDSFTGSEKKPGATERIKQKVLGDTPDREADPVKAAQRALRTRGYDPGPVDGNLGAKTRTAVKEFQKDEGLEVTGRLDADTMNRLRRDGETAEKKGRDTADGSALPRQDREANRPGPGASSESPFGELAKDTAQAKKKR